LGCHIKAQGGALLFGHLGAWLGGQFLMIGHSFTSFSNFLLRSRAADLAGSLSAVTFCQRSLIRSFTACSMSELRYGPLAHLKVGSVHLCVPSVRWLTGRCARAVALQKSGSGKVGSPITQAACLPHRARLLGEACSSSFFSTPL
jgi:hypothetical protein